MNRVPFWCLAASFLWLATAASASDPLPEDAARLVAAFEEDAEALRLEAERKIAVERRALAVKLKELQDKYTRAALLDEAVAIRDKVRTLSESTFPAQADPGSMSAFTAQIGMRFHFRVTGSTNGTIYGTDIYTYDSSVATAAVHTGVLRVGETGVVKVTMLPGRDSYLSSTRNGITSSQWSNYSASFQVERVKEIPLPPEGKVPNEPQKPKNEDDRAEPVKAVPAKPEAAPNKPVEPTPKSE